MKTESTLEMEQGTDTYHVDRVEMDKISPDLLLQWSALLKRNGSESPMHDPQWLSECFCDKPRDVSVYFLYRGELLAGFAPFVTTQWPVKLQLGEITLARLPLNRLRLLGGSAHFPEDPAAYTMLFREVAAREGNFDALYLDDAAVDSFLWRFLESSPIIDGLFSRYQPEAPAPRVLLRLNGSFDDYMGTFSSKHRQTLRRKARKFQDVAPGETRCIRCTTPEEVDGFLEKAAAISEKTYQQKLLGGGVRVDEKTRAHHSYLARHGWMRSYLLVSKDTPCAFVTGYQYGSRYYLDDMGYDPAWRDYSVGTVLQLGIIEDLFGYDPPAIYDLGEYGPHKEEFATDNYLQGKLFLFRRGVYTHFVRTGHKACNASTEAVSGLLERFGWKAWLKKTIRMWSSRS